MAVINFKEIPAANIASGDQDAFELFAADFLDVTGYSIVERPSRGIDLGKDLIVDERRTGVGGETVIRWLVSCKHKAHSGRSVGLDDEPNIGDRIRGKKCQGFMGFYSTLPSSQLIARLNELRTEFEILAFDRALIEKHLLAENAKQVAERYFPASMQRWQAQHLRPANVFSAPENLECQVCRKDLLSPEPSGILVLWEAPNEDGPELGDNFIDAHWCCKGRCDLILEARMHTQHGKNVSNGWQDIPDLCIPLVFIQKIMAFLNGFQNGDRWSSEAFKKLKSFLLTVFQHVARDISPGQQERIENLLQYPEYLGGLGRSGD